MIWNPWKEIAKLREELSMTKYHLNLAMMEENTVRECWVHADNRVQAMRDVLDKIGQMETPRCSNVVRKITRMAREALG